MKIKIKNVTLNFSRSAPRENPKDLNIRELCKEHNITGPWMSEPDRIEWKSPTGLDCLMVRHESSFHWCGYAAVTKTHPLFGKDYGELDDVNVHGGLTYANSSNGHESDSDEDVWWFGFDCAHGGDIRPVELLYPHILPTWPRDLKPPDAYRYRDAEWVRAEVESLARQLKDLA